MPRFKRKPARCDLQLCPPHGCLPSHRATAHLPTRREVTGCRPASGMKGLLTLATTVTGGQPLFASGARRQLDNFFVIGAQGTQVSNHKLA